MAHQFLLPALFPVTLLKTERLNLLHILEVLKPSRYSYYRIFCLKGIEVPARKRERIHNLTKEPDKSCVKVFDKELRAWIGVGRPTCESSPIGYSVTSLNEREDIPCRCAHL
jgi:hypothetical protein